MKYAVVLCDGMADYPVEALGGKTPMEVAKKPNIDALASKGEVGLVRTVAAGLKPGSDVANIACSDSIRRSATQDARPLRRSASESR